MIPVSISSFDSDLELADSCSDNVSITMSDEDAMREVLLRRQAEGGSALGSRCVLSELCSSKRGELSGELVSSVKMASKPLGCTFCETSRIWAICDNFGDKIVLADEELRSGLLMKESLVRPAAVSVVERYNSLGVLDDKAIYLFDIREHGGEFRAAFTRVTKTEILFRRGLAVSSCGNYLISTESNNTRTQSEIVYYDVRRPESRACMRFPYLADNENVPGLNPKPSFIDFYKGLLVVSDLGRKIVSRYKVDEDSVLGCRVESVNPYLLNHSFSYPAGVFIDEEMELLVVDARRQQLLWFNRFGFLIRNVKLDRFLYTSGIYVNREGFLLASGRANDAMHLYRLRAS